MQVEALFEPISPDSKMAVLHVFEETYHLVKVGEGSYRSKFPPEIDYYEIAGSYPLTAKQGNAGEITFHRIEFYPDKTMITFSVQGLDPHTQDGAWWIEDEAGNKYSFDRYDLIRLNDFPFTYEVALPALDPGAGLKLAVIQLQAPKLIQELEIPISLE